MSFMDIVGSGLASVRAAGVAFGALPTGRKIGYGLAAANVAGSYKAYGRAQQVTRGKGLGRTAKIAAKTIGGTAYWLTSLGLEMLNTPAPTPRKKAKKAKKAVAKKASPRFDRAAMNIDMEKIRVGTTPKALARMYKQGLVVMHKHHAPARYTKAFKSAMKFAIAEAKIKATKQPASSILTPAAAKHSANKFAKKAEAKAKKVAPVVPVTAEAKKS